MCGYSFQHAVCEGVSGALRGSSGGDHVLLVEDEEDADYGVVVRVCGVEGNGFDDGEEGVDESVVDGCCS